MTGTLTITTRLLTGKFENGLRDLAKKAKDTGESISASFKSFAKIAVIIGLILATVKLISGAWDKLKENNSELMAKLELISRAFGNIMSAIYTGIANLIGPIINKVADWILKLLGFINAIVKAFGGADIFAKSTAKSMKSTAKSAKEVNKSLAGFDQINQLSDNSGGGAGGIGGGGSKMPEIKIPDVKLPKWIEWLIEKVKYAIQWWGEFFKKVGEWYNTILVPKVQDFIDKLRYLKDHFGEILEFIKTSIKNKLIDIKNFIVETFNSIKTFMTEKIITPIVNAFTKVKETISSVFESIKTVITDKVINPIKSKLESLKSTCVSIFNGIKDALKGPLNTMIGWINTLINGLNKVSIKVPAWVNQALGKGNKESKWGFNISKIPKLAQGGIVSNPGPGVNMGNYIAGERGAEAIIPLNDNTLQRLANMIPITIDLTNTIDGRVLNRRLETIRTNDNFSRNGVN